MKLIRRGCLHGVDGFVVDSPVGVIESIAVE